MPLGEASEIGDTSARPGQATVQSPAPLADPAGFFGLRGKIKIGSAAAFLDGGSVLIELIDEHGAELVVSRRVLLFAEQAEPVSVSFRGRQQGKYFLSSGGPEERALLALLQQAKNETYLPDFTPANSERFELHPIMTMIRVLKAHLKFPE